MGGREGLSPRFRASFAGCTEPADGNEEIPFFPQCNQDLPYSWLPILLPRLSISPNTTKSYLSMPCQLPAHLHDPSSSQLITEPEIPWPQHWWQVKPMWRKEIGPDLVNSRQRDWPEINGFPQTAPQFSKDLNPTRNCQFLQWYWTRNSCS